VLLVCAAYYAGAIFGITFRLPPAGIGGIATIWPPNAIVLAALLLTPPRVWWVYLLALLPTHLHVVANFQGPVPLVVMFSQYAGNMVQAVLGAAAIRAVGGAPPRFDSLRGMASFVLLAAVLVPALASALAVTLFLQTGWVTDFWFAWRQRFFANGLAVIVITPTILLAAAGDLAGAQRARRRYAELALVTLGLFAVGSLVLVRDALRPGIMPALLLAPLPFFLWAAVRLGPGGVCVCLVAVTAMSWTTVYTGRWPFVTQSPTETVQSVHAFLLTISIPMMLMAALVEERRRTEEESRRQRDALAHAQRVATLGELAASIAHELGQPLSAIMTNAVAGRRMLETADRGSPDAVREILIDINEEANHGAQVIGRLRTLFRRASAERVGLDVNTVIENGLGLLRANLREKNVTVRFARNETLPRVFGDPVQLQQVVVNLVMNAGDAAASAGDETPRVITIDAGEPGSGRLRFSVTDSGIGVKDPADLERIFEHFVSTKSQGMGLGLTISRSIVETHGGRIWAVANATRGLTVHVELPTLAAVAVPNDDPLHPSVRQPAADVGAARLERELR
jgi:signal transduction histidine kinase